VNQDEKTTEIEIPSTTLKNNIVRIDFAANNDARRILKTDNSAAVAAPVMPIVPAIHDANPMAAMSWATDLDMHSPWVLRLVAVMFVLILSMLIL